MLNFFHFHHLSLVQGLFLMKKKEILKSRGLSEGLTVRSGKARQTLERPPSPGTVALEQRVGLGAVVRPERELVGRRLTGPDGGLPATPTPGLLPCPGSRVRAHTDTHVHTNTLKIFNMILYVFSFPWYTR